MMLKTTVLILILACGASGFAQVDFIEGDIGVISNQVSNTVGNVPGNRLNGILNFDYHKNPGFNYSDGIERKFSFSTQVNDQNLTTFSLKEAYISGKFLDKNHLKVGRQIRINGDFV